MSEYTDRLKLQNEKLKKQREAAWGGKSQSEMDIEKKRENRRNILKSIRESFGGK